MNPPGSNDTKFAELLRHWRQLRNMSQEDLADALGHSTRHISFLETNKANPTLATLRNLVGVLGIPGKDAEQLIKLAGYAPHTQDDAGDWESLDPAVKRTLSTLVAGIWPHAAAITDARHRMVRMNLVTAAYMSAFGDIDGLFDDGYLSWARLVFHPDCLRHTMPNWEEYAWSLIQWVHRNRYRIPDVGERVYQDILSLTDLPLQWQRLGETVEFEGGAPLQFASPAGVAKLQNISFMVSGHPGLHTHDYPELNIWVLVAMDDDSVRVMEAFNAMVSVDMVHPKLMPALAHNDRN